MNGRECVFKKKMDSPTNEILPQINEHHAETEDIIGEEIDEENNEQEAETVFYKRILPDTCTALSSPPGKKLFQESLLSGNANIYFRLAEQFRTQAEPAYCGLATLVMVLNALEVDPKRLWKGVWRWYDEAMLNCCLSLDAAQQEGITMEQYITLATCNNLSLNVGRMNDAGVSIEEFRRIVKEVCAGDEKVLTCSYSRAVLGQTGDGHFSPIGAYHPEEDMLLIFDVARFKYPPHWIKVQLMWDSMKALDSSTELPRGYVVMKKAEEIPLLLFKVSNTFRVALATRSNEKTSMSFLLKTWTTFLKCEVSHDQHVGKFRIRLDKMIKRTLDTVEESLAAFFEEESLFSTKEKVCCLNKLPSNKANKIRQLLLFLQFTDVFVSVDEWIHNNNNNNNDVCLREKLCKRAQLCTNKKYCKHANSDQPLIDIEEAVNQNDSVMKDNNSDSQVRCRKTSHDFSSNCDHVKQRNITSCNHNTKNSDFITASHYITLMILCWPYCKCDIGKNSWFMAAFIDKSLADCDALLLNEIKLLRAQMKSLM